MERDKFGREDEKWEESLEQGRRLAKAGPGRRIRGDRWGEGASS